MLLAATEPSKFIVISFKNTHLFLPTDPEENKFCKIKERKEKRKCIL